MGPGAAPHTEISLLTWTSPGWLRSLPGDVSQAPASGSGVATSIRLAGQFVFSIPDQSRRAGLASCHRPLSRSRRIPAPVSG